MHSKAFHIIILVLCIALIGASYAFTLNELGVHFFGFKWRIHCFLNHTFGVRCAFCGMTRSFTSMAHGRFEQAFAFHPLGPILFGLIVFQVPYRLWALKRHPKKLPRILSMLHKLALTLIIIAVFLYWILRLYADALK